MHVTSRCPVRIDFAGAWTDVDLFARHAAQPGQSGAVVNAAIDRFVEGSLTVGESADEEGLRVEYHCDLPSGSGLGTSAALNVCWLGLVQARQAGEAGFAKCVAEQAYRLEELLGILGGRQDQYAAALGGFHYLTFGAQVGVERLELAPEFVTELEARLVLCYTGTSRLSGNIHAQVWGAYGRGEPATVRALHALREGADQMRAALLSSDVEAFARLIGESWTHQKALDASVTNATIDALFDTARSAGAPTGKACGAGGGGCLLFVAEPGRQAAVTGAVHTAGARPIPFRFEPSGLQVRCD